jgi:hypothetical protein
MAPPTTWSGVSVVTVASVEAEVVVELLEVGVVGSARTFERDVVDVTDDPGGVDFVDIVVETDDFDVVDVVDRVVVTDDFELVEVVELVDVVDAGL